MRTREEQVEYACQQIVQSSSWANLEGWMRGHIQEAESRGAEEQRRKDAEGQEPVAWENPETRSLQYAAPMYSTQGSVYFHPGWRPLYTRAPLTRGGWV